MLKWKIWECISCSVSLLGDSTAPSASFICHYLLSQHPSPSFTVITFLHGLVIITHYTKCSHRRLRSSGVGLHINFHINLHINFHINFQGSASSGDLHLDLADPIQCNTFAWHSGSWRRCTVMPCLITKGMVVQKICPKTQFRHMNKIQILYSPSFTTRKVSQKW